MRRAFTVALLLLLPGCVAWVPANARLEEVVAAQSREAIRVHTSDGQRVVVIHPFLSDGYVVGRGPSAPRTIDLTENLSYDSVRVLVPVRAVTSVDLRRFSATRTVAYAAVAIAPIVYVIRNRRPKPW